MWLALAFAVGFFVLAQFLIPTQKAKAGTFEDFDFPRVDDGSPIYYFAGRLKVESPNLTWYGDFKSKPIKKKSGLFKKSTVGYKYYLGFQLCISLGPDVILRKIWFGQEEAGYTGANTGGSFRMADKDAFGGETGGGGYDLAVTFYPGSSTQDADPYLEQHIEVQPGAVLPAWRGVAYVVAHGYIGNSTNLNPMSFEVERIPDPLGLGNAAKIGDEGDANPANIMYEIMTLKFGGLGMDPLMLDTDSFVQGGLRFFAEDEGCSCGFGGSAGKAANALSDLLKQCDSQLFEDPVTGVISLKLLRDDYDHENLPRVTISDVEVLQSYSTNLWADTRNKVRVQFTDRARDYKTDAIAVAEDMANIVFQGDTVKANTSEYPHVKRMPHALRKATSELAIVSTPIPVLRLSTLRFDINLRPGSVFALDYAPYGIQNLIVRVRTISLGDLVNNRLAIEVTQDKFAQTETIYGAGPSSFVKPSLGAVSIVTACVLEAPRWLVSIQDTIIDVDAPRVLALPKRPSGSQLGFDIYGKVEGESVYTDIGVDVPYPAVGFTRFGYPMSYDYDDVTGIVLESMDDDEELREATLSEIQNYGVNLIQVDDEIMAFETFEINGDGKYVLKGIYRALLDTVPAAHPAGARVVWLSAELVGTREFIAGDDVEVVLASKAPRGAQDETTGLHMTVPTCILSPSDTLRLALLTKAGRFLLSTAGRPLLTR